MPVLTTRAITNSAAGLVRTRLSHSACGMRMLHRISIQYQKESGPKARLIMTARSHGLPLNQPTNASMK